MTTFDLMNLPGDFVPNAYKYFDVLRAESPVHWNSDGSVILTRYEDIVSVYRNPQTWSSEKRAVFAPKFGTQSPLYEHHTTSLVFRDPPDHTRIRKLFQHAFTPKSLAALEPMISALIDRYLDQLADLGNMEVVSDFSFRLPVEVVCDMLGAPREDRELIRDWALLILGALEPQVSEEQILRGNKAVENFKTYLRDQIAARRRNPSVRREGEILSDLMAAEEEGSRLTEIELLHQCIFMLNAGHETSTNMLSHGVHEFLINPGEIGRLIESSDLVDSATEEVLRYQAPIQINNRLALIDTELGGFKIPAGTTAHLMIGAANRDPSQFSDPNRFDIARRPNRHLSFGLGIHICAGNTLARIEARLAFEKLFQRFPNLKLSQPAKLSNRVRFREVQELRVEI
jgi:cytochrome P450